MNKRVDVVKNPKRGIADCAGARQKVHLELDEQQERKRRKRKNLLLKVLNKGSSSVRILFALLKFNSFKALKHIYA